MSINRIKVLNTIFNSASSSEQATRFLKCIDNYPSISLALDANNRELAIEIVEKAKSEGALTQEDLDLILIHFNKYAKPKIH